MKKYSVSWTKVYYSHGEEVVYAEDRVGAEKIVEDKIGDLEGSMQYVPDDNYVEAFELTDLGARNH